MDNQIIFRIIIGSPNSSVYKCTNTINIRVYRYQLAYIAKNIGSLAQRAAQICTPTKNANALRPIRSAVMPNPI